MELNKLSPLGFGSYRVSIKSSKNKEALKMALELGVNLIDTSANYTDGDSERLIGEVLKENPTLDAFIMTKAGYIQGKNLYELERLNREGKALDDLVNLTPNLKHSIHPEFLQNQLDLSLQRLGRESIDGFLLHNPEYFFDQDGEQDPNVYYSRIKMAFTFLEEKVKEGKIKHYGISSNTFPGDPELGRTTNILTVMKLAGEVSSSNHFRLVQFPMNMIENGAIVNMNQGKNLIEWCKIFKLHTFVNRPLNAFSSEGLIRLASYEFMDEPMSDIDADEAYNLCFNLLKKRWKSQNLEEKLEDIPLMKQFKELWKFLPSPDAVDQVFQGHFFPLIAQIWGGAGLSAEESKPFYLLYDIAQLLSRRNMGLRAREYQVELAHKGILNPTDTRPLSVQCIDSYLKAGVDHVLVGMRDPRYVEMLKSLF
ncbi:MAG: aldo/keto reductase [Bacteriovoracaceae bacterium]